MDEESLRRKFAALNPALDERARRLVLAAEAREIGRGGIAIVSRASGASRSTIRRGIKELGSGEGPVQDRIRRPGAGRKSLVETDATLLTDLESLVEPHTRGDPESALQWTSKSTQRLADELRNMGHVVSARSVAKLLVEAGFSLQANQKAKEGTTHPDRNAQFEHIEEQVRKQQKSAQPVISVDTKKKELVGDFKNAGKEYRPEGMPERVRVHDFIDETKGKAVPYGVYDLTKNSGWVSVGIDHDTATFAVNSIARWWEVMGRELYPNAKSLLITADAGGSNSARSRLWKLELQRFADDSGLSIRVCHFPPGTSKWNKIEHRLFSFISLNWRGRPLTSLAVIVNLIASTRTQTGLRVRAELDKGKYPKGREISKTEMATINLHPDSFHGDWNYVIKPRS